MLIKIFLPLYKMFGFPQISKPDNFQYNKNFLRTVTLQFKYSKVQGIISKREDLVKLLQVKFPNHKDIQSNTIQFKSVQNRTELLPQGHEVSGVIKQGNFQQKIRYHTVKIMEMFILILNLYGKKLKKIC